jgi:hypothetical protein
MRPTRLDSKRSRPGRDTPQRPPGRAGCGRASEPLPGCRGPSLTQSLRPCRSCSESTKDLRNREVAGAPGGGPATEYPPIIAIDLALGPSSSCREGHRGPRPYDKVEPGHEISWLPRVATMGESTGGRHSVDSGLLAILDHLGPDAGSSPRCPRTVSANCPVSRRAIRNFISRRRRPRGGVAQVWTYLGLAVRGETQHGRDRVYSATGSDSGCLPSVLQPMPRHREYGEFVHRTQARLNCLSISQDSFERHEGGAAGLVSPAIPCSALSRLSTARAYAVRFSGVAGVSYGSPPIGPQVSSSSDS